MEVISIDYTEARSFTSKELRDLFLSVDWASGEYPDLLLKAIQNYETVIAARDGNKLIGLICAMDDGIMTAYIHYLLVDPRYQKYGIGKELINRIKNKYSDYLRLVLVCYDGVVGFYERCGFKRAEGTTPMYLTELRN